MEVFKLPSLTDSVAEVATALEVRAEQAAPWKGRLTTQTSQTMLEFMAACTGYSLASIRRVWQDSFSDTSQSDESQYALARHQGIRIPRSVPAGMEIAIRSPVTVSLPSFTQFTVGSKWYTREVINLQAGVEYIVTVFQGQIEEYQMYGLGTEFQTFTSEQDNFTVADLDVSVWVAGQQIPQTLNGALWNCKGEPGYANLTDSNGRMSIVFGREGFGTMPSTDQVVRIRYPVTLGADANALALEGRTLVVDGFPNIEATVVSNPGGGAFTPPAEVYKNNTAGAFGTYESGTTKRQYRSLVVTYPGIIDSTTQAQREINTMALRWMNIIRVSALTNSPWNTQQKQDFCEHMQNITMYSSRFLWQDPIPLPRDLDIDVYLFNTADITQVRADIIAALTTFFSERRGILMLDIYETDITQVIKKACKGEFNYAIDRSNYPFIATMPPSPRMRATVIPSGGTLSQSAYSYSVSVKTANGDVGIPTGWVFPQVVVNGSSIKLDWDPNPSVIEYKVWGRSATSLGLLATLPGSANTFTDDGSITPTGSLPTSSADYPIRYNTLRNLNLTVQIGSRQERPV